MSIAEELQAYGAQVVERAGPAVVRIGQGWGRGTGVVVGDGLVLTNAHTLRDETTTVTFADGRSVQGRVAGIDVDGDLVVLGVATEGAAPIVWSPDDATGIGTPVFGVANPGGRGLRVSFGTVSAVGRAFRGPRGRRVAGALEHTAPLGRGSSGGPLVDVEGRLVGINTHRLGEGFYLALPADAELKARVDALARGESVSRVQLGVGLAPSHVARRLRRSVGLPERDGLLIRVVEPDGPAARAGLRVGDLLVSASGQALSSSDQLLDILEGLMADALLALRVVRGNDELDVNVSFTAAEATEGSA
jgi:serine protease Do